MDAFSGQGFVEFAVVVAVMISCCVVVYKKIVRGRVEWLASTGRVSLILYEVRGTSPDYSLIVFTS